MGLITKSESDGSVTFEGYANKAIVDRGNDMIGKKAWKLDNYKKNPIVLFNHDHTKPIGKMINVDAKEDGLWVKGRISNSRDPDISRIRDLVKEGILNSLSVGMRVHDENRENDVNVIKSAELHEISIVAVPMNQDSQFTASAKNMEGKLVDVMGLITREVGTREVSKAYEKLHNSVEIFNDFRGMAEHLARETGASADAAEKFLKMESQETPEPIKRWLDKAEDVVEVKPEEPKLENDEDPMEGKEVHAILVPKDSFQSSEELAAWAEAGGWTMDTIEENDEDYILVQTPVDQFSGEMQTVDLGDGVRALVGILASDEEPKEDPVEEQEEEAKGLLDDNPMTVPLEGRQPEQIEINPMLDAARQTNVLLANVVTLLQQLVEKVPINEAAPPAMITPTEEPLPEQDAQGGMTDEEEELAKSITSFIERTEGRLKSLGL